ncbi:MAG TPA: hypothetical protein VGQ12_15125 [Candidatus Angelobacter sp.]|jgi:hypothetical protein|nr:hypothetical protein [Candidatus Angelobacter sp.]
MSTQYDQEVLQTFADVLYARAKWTALSSAFIYALAGGLSALLIIAAIPKLVPEEVLWVVVLFVAVIAFFVGYEAGSKKAFNLKLQAQQVLCQRQIELNTSRSSACGS